MNRLPQLSSKIEADLRTLVEQLASYISATNRPRAALLRALVLLVSNLQDISDAATNYLATVIENRIG
jgi:hypothetical protein